MHDTIAPSSGVMVGRNVGARAVGVVGALAVQTLAMSAVAQSLSVRTLEGPSWTEWVAAHEREPDTASPAVRVVVMRPGGSLVRCGEYRLFVDEDTASAFSLGACASDTSATAITLVRRADLFDQFAEPPTPRPSTLSAVAVGTTPVSEPQGLVTLRATSPTQPTTDARARTGGLRTADRVAIAIGAVGLVGSAVGLVGVGMYTSDTTMNHDAGFDMMVVGGTMAGVTFAAVSLIEYYAHRRGPPPPAAPLRPP